MKKKTIIMIIVLSICLLTGCEEENNNVQKRQNVLDDGVTMTYTYTDIRGEKIVDELLSKIRMPIGSKEEDLFIKNRKLTYKDINNKDLLLLGAKIFIDENPNSTTMTINDMNNAIHEIIPEEVEIKQKTVSDNNCIKVELKDITYNISMNCTSDKGEYIYSIVTADDANNTAIEIAEKVAYVETIGNEKILYREKDGKEIKRVNINEEIKLENISGLIIVKYTFIKYQDKYYFYSSEKIG